MRHSSSGRGIKSIIKLAVGLASLVEPAILPQGAQGQPGITSQPQDQTNAVGTTATFTVLATGTPPLNYQWYFGSPPSRLAGKTEALLVLTNVQVGNQGGYSMVVTNVEGSVTSAVANLYVIVPPNISKQPTNVIAYLADGFRDSVTASGTPPLSFQWRFNGSELIGYIYRGLSIANVQPTNAGNYDVVVTNLAGSVTSQVARLEVLAPEPNGFEGLKRLPDGAIALHLAGFPPGQFRAYSDLHVVEVSSNLVDWQPLSTIARGNSSPEPLVVYDGRATDSPMQFYRTYTNHLVTFLPAPTGQFPAGVVSRVLTDPNRPNRRPFMISIWYPGVATAGVPPGNYIDPPIATAWAQRFSLGASFVQMSTSFRAYSLPAVPINTARTNYPVVTYSPGQDGPRTGNTAQAENLASHGYIVVGIDHTDAFASVYPDGRIVYGLDNGDYPAMILGRIKDLQFVMDELARWNQNDAFFQGRLDLVHMGALGISLGGATVVELCAQEPRCRAVVCLDGGGVMDMPPFDQPFLYQYGGSMDEVSFFYLPYFLTLFSQHTKDAYLFGVQSAVHQDIADHPLFFDTGQNTLPPAEAHLRVARLLRIYTLSFFNKHLKGEDDHVLDGPLPGYPEIVTYLKK